MSLVDSLHDIFEKGVWNLETIHRSLERDSSAINDKNSLGYTPLQSALLTKKCSVDVVQLLVQKGAEVNCPVRNNGLFSPLVTAIRSSRDEAIIEVLLERGADVNQVHTLSFHETPLLILLKNADCSLGAVKLLLRYGADVNCKDIYGYSPLATALQNSKDGAIISVLLEAGAVVDTVTNFKRSSLCIAFEHASNDVVKLLLDAGCSPKACKYHLSALHCASHYSKMGFREDILKRLLDEGTDINFVDSDGQSVLCFALRNGTNAHNIELLLNEGARLEACRLHSSPLICATGGNIRTPFKAAVMKLLCSRSFNVESHGLEALQSALRYCNYETEAIKLLFELPGMDAHFSDGLLLHATCNPNCKVDVLKLLLKEKDQLKIVNQYRETPLHCAVKECKPVIVDFLLEKGSPVNAKNRLEETPLSMAVKSARGPKIIKSLLYAGAQLSEAKVWKEPSLLTSAFKQYFSYTVDEQDCLETLVKYYFLQNPQCDVQDFVKVAELEILSLHRNEDYSEYKAYANECLSELQKMESLQVGQGCTLRDIVDGNCLPEMHSATSDEGMKYYDFKRILNCFTENAFPVFFDIVCSCVKRSEIESEIQNLLVYTNKVCPDSQNALKVWLNNEVVCKIAEFLLNPDAVRFILAYRGNHTVGDLFSKDVNNGASTSAA